MKKSAPAPSLFAEENPAPSPKAAAKPKPAAKQAKAAPKPEKKPGTAVATRAAANVTALEPTPANVFALISAAAKDPNCDPAKMTTLYELQKNIIADAAARAFTDDFIALQAALPTIRADGRIEIEAKPGKRGQSTPYASFQNIMKTVKPLLREHGFTLSFEPDIAPGTDGRIIMRGHLAHQKGHTRSCAIMLPLETSGSKNNVQGVGSSISYGKRYATIALLNIISNAKEDADLDGHDPKKVIDGEVIVESEKISPKQRAEVIAAIEDCGVGLERFCQHFEIKAVADLLASQFVSAITACANYKANRSGR